MTDLHESITALNWEWHGKCGCAGGGNLYKKGLLTLKHFYKKQRWELRKRGRLIANGHEPGLIEYLTKLNETN